MTPSKQPTRATVGGRAYLDLQNLARRQRRPTDELHQLYALEGFLARLATSAHADRLVLKGGVLLAAYDVRRPTRDVDMLARDTSNKREDVLRLVQGIASARLDDGLVFDAARATADVIRDEDEYSGIRVALSAALASARLSMHVDVNVGDPIWPEPRRVELPRLLGGTITLAGYPLPMVYAEKITTALQRGIANTRWRDFADLYVLTGRHPANGDDVQQALSTVAVYRQIDLSSLTDALDGYASLAQSRWLAWRRKQRLDDRLPESFDDVLAAISAFCEAALNGAIGGQRWDPINRTWA